MIHNFRFFEVASADVCGISLVFGNFHSILGGERDEKNVMNQLSDTLKVIDGCSGAKDIILCYGKVSGLSVEFTRPSARAPRHVNEQI